jgi:hypothetical protein
MAVESPESFIARSKRQLIESRRNTLDTIIHCIKCLNTSDHEPTFPLLSICLDTLHLLDSYTKISSLTREEKGAGLEELFQLKPWKCGYEIRKLLVPIASASYTHPTCMETLFHIRATCSREFELSWDLSKPLPKEVHLKEEIDKILHDLQKAKYAIPLAKFLLDSKVLEARSWAEEVLKNE